MYRYAEPHAPAASGSFGDALVEQIKNAPWFLVSLAIHTVLAIVLHFISSAPAPEVPPETILTVAAPEEIEKPEEEEPNEPLKDPVETPIDTVDVPIKEPVHDDPAEFDSDDAFEESLGESEMATDSPFDSHSTLDCIGTGASAGGGFGRGGGRNGLGSGGGKPPAKTALRGLEWLSIHQSPDGSWDSDRFMQNGDPMKGAFCDGPGRAPHDVGVSGLALLCFLGAGNTHREGPFRENVKRGLKWLKAKQDADGCFGPRGDSHFVYDHAIAALAMAEAYGRSRSVLWKSSAQRGIDFVQQAQNPYKAWRYGVRPGENDVSVTGWMVMALKAGKYAGLEVSDQSLAWALAFIEELTEEETGRTGYLKPGELPVRNPGAGDRFPATETESLTAVAILSRIFAGQDPKKTDAIQRGTELLSRRLPVWDAEGGRCDMYYWYYGTLAMFQVGGPAWNKWNARLKEAVIDTQRKDGNFAGSWDPVGPWGEDGGRVYSTAVMTLCMMVYYRYDRVFGVR